MSTNDFFKERKTQSQVKTAIITKYFWAWTRILKNRTNRIAYIDLFCGPGVYDDGTESTPILILKKCLEDVELANKIITVFNDIDKNTINKLTENMSKIENLNKLRYKPIVICTEVGKDIEEIFSRMKLIPSLAFIDPWGYKGLTNNLIKALTKDFGSDCLFFFNYNRINMGLNNDLVKEHMNNLFGEEIANDIRKNVKNLTPDEKELYILEKLSLSLSNDMNNYILPFRFIDENRNKTSHYLIFVSKHELGYSIMKEIMAKESSITNDGVPSFSYIPTNHISKYSNIQLNLLSNYQLPIDQLGDMLITEFKGQTLSVSEIYKKHHIGKNFIKSNYKDAIRILEEKGLVTLDPPKEKRRYRKGVVTVADSVLVTFH